MVTYYFRSLPIVRVTKELNIGRVDIKGKRYSAQLDIFIPIGMRK